MRMLASFFSEYVIAAVETMYRGFAKLLSQRLVTSAAITSEQRAQSAVRRHVDPGGIDDLNQPGREDDGKIGGWFLGETAAVDCIVRTSAGAPSIEMPARDRAHQLPDRTPQRS